MTEKNKRMEWDSEAYDRLSDPQFSWGTKLLEMVTLTGSETVLDAGCGSGRLTAELLRRLPLGRVVAVDSSDNMLRTARERLEPEFGTCVRFVEADLGALKIDEQVDGIFSNAVFHWVPDHNALFRGLFAALKPGGWLIAQFGGKGNVSRLTSHLLTLRSTPPFSSYLANWKDTKNNASEEETAERMRNAGFTDVETGLHAAPVQFPDAISFVTFVRKVNAHRFVAQLPRELEEKFLEHLARQAALDDPPFLMDYMRLTIRARKPA